MSHIAEEVSVVLIGDLAKTLVIQTSGVAGHSGDDDLRFEQFCVFGELVVIDQTSVGVDFVGHRLEEDGRGGYLLGCREETCGTNRASIARL